MDEEKAKNDLLELIINSANKGIETIFSQDLLNNDYKFTLYDCNTNRQIKFRTTLCNLKYPYYYVLCIYKNYLEKLNKDI
jgi:hypothetical protein